MRHKETLHYAELLFLFSNACSECRLLYAYYPHMGGSN